MDAVIVTIVITLVIGGQDFERREQVKSLPECWDRARMLMDHMMQTEGASRPTTIGIGCVVDAGNPL